MADKGPFCSRKRKQRLNGISIYWGGCCFPMLLFQQRWTPRLSGVIITQRAVTFVVISCKPDIAELAVIEVGEGLQGSSAISPLLE